MVLGRVGFLYGVSRTPRRGAVGGLTVVGMLESLKPNYAFAQQVAKDDARIQTVNQRPIVST